MRSNSKEEKTFEIASGSIDRLKSRAKMLRKQFDPDKNHKLDDMQKLVGACIGRHIRHVFAGREPATSTFPGGMSKDERIAFQRLREIKVLSEFFPTVSVSEIEEFLTKFKLVPLWEFDDVSADGLRGSMDPVEPELMPKLPIPERRRQALSFPASDTPDDVPALSATERERLDTMTIAEPVEIFMPPSIDFIKDRAIKLASSTHLESPAVAYYITARVYGFADWEAFAKSFRLGARSRFDQELDTEKSRQRFYWQVDVLRTLLDLDKIASIELLGKWRPTSQPAGAQRSGVDVRYV